MDYWVISDTTSDVSYTPYIQQSAEKNSPRCKTIRKNGQKAIVHTKDILHWKLVKRRILSQKIVIQ